MSQMSLYCALVTASKAGKQPAKADIHAAHGILLGFGSTPKHIHYYDLTSHRVKPSTNLIIDEAYYGTPSLPAGPQIVMDIGYEMSGANPPLPYTKLSYMPLSDVYMAASKPLPLHELTPIVNAVSKFNMMELACSHDSVTVLFIMGPYRPCLV